MSSPASPAITYRKRQRLLAKRLTEYRLPEESLLLLAIEASEKLHDGHSLGGIFAWLEQAARDARIAA